MTTVPLSLAHLQLCLRGILPDGPENGAELLGVDDAVVVEVELEEGVLERPDLLLRQALRRHPASVRSVSVLPPLGRARCSNPFLKATSNNNLRGPLSLQTRGFTSLFWTIQNFYLEEVFHRLSLLPASLSLLEPQPCPDSDGGRGRGRSHKTRMGRRPLVESSPSASVRDGADHYNGKSVGCVISEFAPSLTPLLTLSGADCECTNLSPRKSAPARAAFFLLLCCEISRLSRGQVGNACDAGQDNYWGIAGVLYLRSGSAGI